jgi:hypothetical protein
MAKKQHGWLVRDPKGKVVSDGESLVFETKERAIYAIWWGTDTNDGNVTWWRKARREGYTIERKEL